MTLWVPSQNSIFLTRIANVWSLPLWLYGTLTLYNGYFPFYFPQPNGLHHGGEENHSAWATLTIVRQRSKKQTSKKKFCSLALSLCKNSKLNIKAASDQPSCNYHWPMVVILNYSNVATCMLIHLVYCDMQDSRWDSTALYEIKSCMILQMFKPLTT